MDSRTIFDASEGHVCEGMPLKNSKNEIATGCLWLTDDDDLAVPFRKFYPYTSIVGFAAYAHEYDENKLILINRSRIQRIFID